jgi:PAS domain S-box-containing protein
LVASVDRALSRVWGRLLIELLGNGLKTLLVAVFLLLVFQYFVTHHLIQVARFMRGIDPARPLPPDLTLELDRPATGHWRPDILDAVTTALNGLLRSLEQARAERDASHEQLARSELRLRLSVEAAGAGLWDCDLGRDVVEANADCAGLLGRRPHELPTRLAAWRQLSHPDDLPSALLAIARHVRQESPRMEIECRVPTARGWRWMSVRGRIVDRAPDGAPLRAVGTLVDVHERMVAQAAQREREERFRGIAEMNVDLVFQTDADGQLRFVSPSARALFGMAPEEMTGQAFVDRVAPEHRPEAERTLARVMAGETLRNIELSGLRRDGSHFPFEANITPIRIDGMVGGAQGVLRDIGERRRAEAAVRDNEARLRALTAHTAALICELDADGRVLFANRGGEPPRRKLVGTVAREWVPPERQVDFDRALHWVLATGDRETLVLNMQDDDAGERHYMVTLAAMPGGGEPRVVSTATEITELKRAEEALLEANRGLEARVRDRTAALEAARDEAQRANLAKSEFLSRMSHELRTPMNAIMGFAQILQMGDLAPKPRRWAGEIHRAGDHLLRLIDELLDLARIEVGRLAVSAQPLELGQAVNDAVSMCEGMLAGTGVTLDVEPGVQAIRVMADPTRLRQILVNLISNAIKYNRPGGSVRVGGRTVDPEFALLTVSDTGLGVPANKLDRLFVPFERLGREGSSVPGAGIGLALSRGLAELMGGALGVESCEGEGSTFWIRLPLSAQDCLPSPPPAPAAPVLERQLRLLYIEDNAANLALLETWFEEFPSISLLTAEDGPTGIACALAERPDLILLDIKLPGMDGYAVLEELKRDERTANIPIIAVSADAMPHDIARGRAAGFSAYVAKPIRLNELMARIDECSAGVVGSDR